LASRVGIRGRKEKRLIHLGAEFVTFNCEVDVIVAGLQGKFPRTRHDTKPCN